MLRKVFTVPFSFPAPDRILWQEALTVVAGPDFSGILYIAPTPLKIEAARKSFWTEAKKRGYLAVIPPQFFTLKQFANYLFSRFGSGIPFAEEFRPLLLMSVSKNSLNPGLAKALSVTIKDIKQYRPSASVDQLQQEVAKKFTADQQTAEKIISYLGLMAKSEQILKKAGYYDSEDILGLAPSFLKSLTPAKLLVLDGFYDLTPLEEDFVSNILREETDVLALAYYDPQEETAYRIPDRFRRFLLTMGLEESRFTNSSPGLAERFFCEAPDPETEVERIAALIKTAVLTEKRPLEEIMVIFPNLNNYRSLVERTFFRYGIPVQITGPVLMRATAPVQTILALLDCLEDDFPRLATVGLFTSPLLSKIPEKVKGVINRLSLSAGLIKGAKDWRSLETKLQKGSAKSADFGFTSEEVVGVQKEVKRLLDSAQKIVASQPVSMAEYLKRMRQFLSQWGWEEALENFPRPVVENIQSFLYQAVTISERFLPQKESFASFATTLRGLLSTVTYQPEGEGVLVTDLLDSRGLFPAQLFCGGLSDEAFPRKPTFDPILPEYLKEALGLPNLNIWLEREKLHFLRLSKTGESRLFSYSAASGDDFYLPSPFLSDYQKISFTAPDGFFSPADLPFISVPAGVVAASCAGVNLNSDPQALKIINQLFGPGNTISITLFDDYQRCPYQFYLRRVLKIEERPEPDYRVEPKEWGNLAHQLMQKVMAACHQTEELPYLFSESLEELLAQYQLGQIWEEIAQKVFTHIADQVVEQENLLRDKGFQPIAFEKKIEAELATGLSLRGRIDRIDSSEEGALLIDYKTGSQTGRTGFGESSLQLPLYACLYQRATSEKVTGLLIYPLAELEKPLKITSYTLEIEEKTIQKAQEIIAKIRRGQFSAEPSQANNCRSCAYRFACGYPGAL